MTTPKQPTMPLDVRVMRGRTKVCEARIEVHPDDSDALRQHLLDAMWREHRRRKDALPDYTMEIRRPGRELSNHAPWRTFTDLPDRKPGR